MDNFSQGERVLFCRGFVVAVFPGRGSVGGGWKEFFLLYLCWVMELFLGVEDRD